MAIAPATASANSARRKTCAEVKCSLPHSEGAGDGQPQETTSDKSQYSEHLSPELLSPVASLGQYCSTSVPRQQHKRRHLPSQNSQSCHCHCCRETRRSLPKGSKVALVASDFLRRGRKGRRCTHGPSSLALSRRMASPLAGLLLHPAASQIVGQESQYFIKIVSLMVKMTM